MESNRSILHFIALKKPHGKYCLLKILSKHYAHQYMIAFTLYPLKAFSDIDIHNYYTLILQTIAALLWYVLH